MAALAGTFLSSAAKGNREELSDVVSRITPEDTPIYSMIGKETAKNVFSEWEIDALAAPASNAYPEGDEYTYDASAAATRVGNYAQIMRKTWVVSNTQEAMDNAGKAEQIKTLRLKRGIEIKKDTELAIVSNTASVATGTRLMGSLPSWLTTNVSRGATGANGGYSTGTKLTVAETTGTQRAFTKALLDTTMQQAYQSGANVKQLVVSPYVKSVFVTFMSDTNVAAFRHSVDGASKQSIVATADIYEGPFGKVTVVPNRVMAASAAVARRAYLIDPEMLAMKVLRKIQDDTSIASTGDATKGVIIGEHTLSVKNEAGLGVIADVFGLTAST